jgi:hypothetical protein
MLLLNCVVHAQLSSHLASTLLCSVLLYSALLCSALLLLTRPAYLLFPANNQNYIKYSVIPILPLTHKLPASFT